MSWRKYPTHRTETKAVKVALAEAGYVGSQVGHGNGTAWGWLEVQVQRTKPSTCACPPTPDEQWGYQKCRACRDTWNIEYGKLVGLLLDVTGRSEGEYGGNITISIELV